MSITLDFLSLDSYFRSTTGDKVILNDLSYLSLKDTELVKKELSTIYDKVDVISTIPTCDCGALKGGYLLEIICKKCGSRCKDVFEKVEPLLWMRSLWAGEEEIKFLNPHFWTMVENLISKGKFKGLRWLCDSTYNPNVLISPIISQIHEMIGGKRLYSNTMKFIPDILEFIKLNDLRYKKSVSACMKIDYLKKMFLEQHDKIFSSYLPIVNKKLFVMEKTTKGIFTNLSMSYMVDAVRMWVKYASSDNVTEVRKNITTCNAVNKLARLYEHIYYEFVIKKQGIVRKHNFGARSDFTFRAVITAIMGEHQHNEVHIPWKIGVTAFRPHLLNLLVNRLKYSYKDANKKLFRAVYNYDVEIDQLLDTLVREAPDGKIWVNMQRNPSLLQGSSLKVYVGKFKKDVDDRTIGISPLVVAPMNADEQLYA